MLGQTSCKFDNFNLHVSKLKLTTLLQTVRHKYSLKFDPVYIRSRYGSLDNIASPEVQDVDRARSPSPAAGLRSQSPVSYNHTSACHRTNYGHPSHENYGNYVRVRKLMSFSIAVASL